MLPHDIIRSISLYCSPGIMACNKELLVLYNDIWYMDKLQLYNPAIKLYTATNYSDLYKRYKRQGTIRYFQYNTRYNLKVEGIKASCSHIGANYILTFNGELYHEFDSKIELIDTQVVDIDKNTYIKENLWFINNKDEFICLDMIPTSKFNKVYNDGRNIYAITSDGIYYIVNYKQQLKIQFHPLTGIRDIISNYLLHVVNDKNESYNLFRIINKIIQLPIDNKIIFKAGRGLYDYDNQPIYTSNYNSNYEISYQQITSINNRIRSFHAELKLRKHFVCNDNIVVLIDDMVYVYHITANISTTIDKIHDIFAAGDKWYMIS